MVIKTLRSKERNNIMATPAFGIAAIQTPGNKIPSTPKSSSTSKCSSPSSSSSNNFESILNSKSVSDKQQQASGDAPPSSSINGDAGGRVGPPRQRHLTEEVNEDSIYSIHLKKITYTFNNVLNKQHPSPLYNGSGAGSGGNYVTRCDQVDGGYYCGPGSKEVKNNNTKWHLDNDQQSLQWETRQLRTIKAATIEHLIQYILLLTPNQQAQYCHKTTSQNGNAESDNDDECNVESSYLLEERNNVAHAMHVLFATYRQFVYPWQLFTEIIRQKPFASVKQFNFILFYWLNNYPEDFWTSCQPSSSLRSNGQPSVNGGGGADQDNEDESSSLCYSEYASSSLSSQNYNTSSSLSSTVNSQSSSSSSSISSSSSTRFSPLTIADQLISMRHIDEEVKKHCLHLLDMKKENNTFNNHTLNHAHKSISKSSSIIELDAKFIAQQLTAIDLENFLALKSYTLLSNARSKTKIEIMIRNFNLLSRHVIVTILQHSSPNLVTIHWIEIAHHLRKMRNFNSLKAIIAGLTNESIYRLKSTIWNKLPRSSLNTFTYLSSIVDDVNNQTLLRHTQLFIEGTSKVSLEESFGTVPYLGTFLTDITMINTRYDNYIKLENGKKLINFEKCYKQYEVLMQLQLLQKNAIAALQQQQQQQNYHLEPIYSLNHYLSLRSQSVPSIPRVARIFRNWFQMNDSDLPNDRECYQLSLTIESPPNKNNSKK